MGNIAEDTWREEICVEGRKREGVRREGVEMGRGGGGGGVGGAEHIKIKKLWLEEVTEEKKEGLGRSQG